MSSSSSQAIQPNTSSLSSNNDYRNFNPVGLTQGANYQERARCVSEEFARFHADRDNPLFRRRMSPRNNQNVFQVTEDELTPMLFGVGASAGGGAVGDIGQRILSSSSTAGPISLETALSDSFQAVSRSAPSSSSIVDGLRGRAGGLLGIAITGLISAYAVSSYRQLARELRTEIEQRFHDISDAEVNRQQFTDSVQGLVARKNGNWFSRIFDYYNPTPLGYLLLTEGIALDSNGRFAEAQQRYHRALENNIDPHLGNMLRYAYARSLRLSAGDQGAIFNQINAIGAGTHFNTLGEIERRRVNDEEGVMDDHHIPYTFLCPITQDVMVNPTYYEIEGHRHYFEGDAIQAWLVNHQTCPITRRPLIAAMLVHDAEHAQLIRTWNLTALKPA